MIVVDTNVVAYTVVPGERTEAALAKAFPSRAVFLEDFAAES